MDLRTSRDPARLCAVDGEIGDSQETRSVTPFLKWAGGKRWFAKNHSGLLNHKCKRYIEPFLGSGAIFFQLAPTSALLSDQNTQLISTFQAIKDSWKSVLHHLKRHHRNHNRDYYYSVRKSEPQNIFTAAARFIYLNRTCWNGLYRVNLRGDFNVPIGTKSSVVFDDDRFDLIASRLSNAELTACDFEDTIDRSGVGDFVFIDPPYTVKHNTNGFVKYNEKIFRWGDQIRLRDAVQRAKQRGAKVLITNAHHASVVELYQGLGHFLPLQRKSVIAGRSDARGIFDELVIKCF